MTVHTAVVSRWDAEFYFVSPDGEEWLEVNHLPESDADVAHLYLFDPDFLTKHQFMPIVATRRYLESIEWGVDKGTVMFGKVG